MSSLLVQLLTEHGFTTQSASDVSQAKTEIATFDPDMLLLDVYLGDGPTGIHLAHSIRRSRPDIAILVFTSQTDVGQGSRGGMALPPGVGFLRKHLVNDKQYLIEAMERVWAEQATVAVDRREAEDPFSFLGATGSRTLRLLAQGYDNDEIARRCGVSRKTIERWIEQIYRDLGIETKDRLNPRVAAARRYFLSVGVPPLQD